MKHTAKKPLGQSAVFMGHKRFAQGRDSEEDEEHTGRPSTVRTELKIQEVATLVGAVRSQTVGEIESAGISHVTCHILSDNPNMSRGTQHIVPRVLTQDRRDDRMSTYGDLIDSVDKDAAFHNQIITGEETWRSLYDLQLNRQSSTWKSSSSPRKKKPRQDKFNDKAMLELFTCSSSHKERL
jgi:hypothetical protein